MFATNGVSRGPGVGLRYTIEKKDHINIRIDFAYGEEFTFYLGVGEVF